ncbi:MAG TPA: ABC transporter permease [Ruminiclostridium sp.]
MKEFFLLKLLDRFASFFNSLGINYKQLRMILKVKLTLDHRNVPTIMANTKNVENKNLMVMSMFIYSFMGLMISIFVWIPFSTFYKMNMIFGMIIFMILATMIADFSTVLLDVKDKNILLPRPIHNKTIKMAKTIHILYYLFRITLALSGPSLLMCLIHFGPVFFLIMLLEIVLICGLVMFFTSLLYFAILSVFDGEKLKDIINYFQIGLTIFITIAYQFIGRMFSITQMNINFTPKWWNYLIPTTWFAAPLSILTEKSYSIFYVASTAMAVIIPIACFNIYIRTIVPYFEQNLQKLNDNSGGKRQNLQVFRLKKAIASLVCGDKKERAFFTFTQNMIASERKLKLQLYPSLAFSIVLPFIFIFITGSQNSFAETLNALHTSNGYLCIYIGIAMTSFSVYFINMSEKYKGAWIYKALPIENPSAMLKGAFKAFMFKFNIPIVGALGIIFIFLCGPRIIPDVILMLANMLLLAILFFKLSSKQLPFYKDFKTMQSGSNVGVIFLLMFICGVMAGIHFALKQFVPFGITINIAISTIIAMLIWHYSFKISWKDIEINY